MSQIAQALAKAKERTGHTTAPFMTPGSTPGHPVASNGAATAAAKPKTRNPQIFWLIVGCVSLPLTGFVLWSQLGNEAPASAPALPPSASAEGSTTPAKNAPAPSSAKPAPRPSVATSGATPTQRPEIAALVASLPISAVMPGDPPRIMLSGRVVRVGQIVDGELTFAGIADSQLRFTDAKGVVYTRYY